MKPSIKKAIVVLLFVPGFLVCFSQTTPTPLPPAQATLKQPDRSSEGDDVPPPIENGSQDLILIIAEKMPVFRNDPNGVHLYLSQNILYPETAREEGIQGTVYASFVVKTDGSVSGVNIVRGIHPSLNDEVVRVLSAMPAEWAPGEQSGKKVSVQYTVPVRFKLEDAKPVDVKGKKKKKEKKQ